MAALRLVTKASTTDWVWDYQCDCGLEYRVRAVGGGAAFWPENGVRSFSHRSVEAGTACVKCGQQRTLEGCSFPDDPPSDALRSDGDGEPIVWEAGVAEALPLDRPTAHLELRCTSCGYGAVASTMPARCPMCGEFGWDFADWRPFSR